MQGSTGRPEEEAGPSRAERFELLGWAHRSVRRRPIDFAEAGAWLSLRYGEAAVRDRRRRCLADDLAGSDFPSAGRICVDDGMGGRLLLQARLSCAYIDLTFATPPMTTFATVDEPMVVARAVVLLACLISDRDAGEYCRGLTDLAQLEWIGEDVVGRFAVTPLELESDAQGPFMEVLAEARRTIESFDAVARLRSPLHDIKTAEPTPSLGEIMEALIRVEASADYFRSCHTDAQGVYAVHGKPQEMHWPRRRTLREARNEAWLAGEREAIRARGEDPEGTGVFVGQHPWEQTLEEHSESYQEFVRTLAEAISRVRAAAAENLQTVPVLPAHFWLELSVSLWVAAGVWHPMCIGRQGQALIRGGCPDFPPRLDHELGAIEGARLKLQCVAERPPAIAPEPVKPGSPVPVTVDVETHVFRRSGSMWTVRFGEEAGSFEHLDGMDYIHELLRTPNPTKPISPLKLVQRKDRGRTRDTPQAPEGVEEFAPRPAPDPVADPEALEEYEERARDITHDLREDRHLHTPEEIAALEEELPWLLEAAAEAKGLGGRVRPFHRSDPEKARKRVHQAIGRCVERFEAHGLKSLASHLSEHLRPGGYSPGSPPPPWAL